MKHFYLLFLALCLVACDKVNAPKCWDENIKQGLSQATWTDVDTNMESPSFGKDVTKKAIKIKEITEIPSSNTKNSRFCNATILYEDYISRTHSYEAIYVISETNKKASFTNFK